VIEYLSGAKAVSESIGLATALVKLKTAVREHPPSKDSPQADHERHGELTEVLGRFRIDTLRVSKNLENKVRALADASTEYGLASSVSISEQLRSLEWYNFLKRSKLKSFREQCNAARRELTSLVDDATAMLICHNRMQYAAEAFKASAEVQKRLDAILFDTSVPLSQQLRIMLDTATEISAKLEE
jgi:hypothetical protein